jgi:hypothetical protein
VSDEYPFLNGDQVRSKEGGPSVYTVVGRHPFHPDTTILVTQSDNKISRRTDSLCKYNGPLLYIATQPADGYVSQAKYSVYRAKPSSWDLQRWMVFTLIYTDGSCRSVLSALTANDRDFR